MQTILIIENDIEELDNLLGIFQEWQTELQILTARDEPSSWETMKNNQVDLLLCSMELKDKEGNRFIEGLTEKFPYIPCIGMTSEHKEEPGLLQGISALHERPYNTPLLFEQISELLDSGTSDSIRGVPPHSLLQMLETEEKTATVKVYGHNETGFIFLSKGEPVAAETEFLKGEEAFFEIITWEDTIIEVLHFNGRRARDIDRPLIALIMEGFRQDGDNNSKDGEIVKARKRPQLKKISTVGQRISLDIGSRIKMEFEHFEGAMDTSLIGMVPGEYLISLFPDQLIVHPQPPKINSHVLVKYLHMGKLCLFKSTLINLITSPQHILFLEYPSVIHYHELRKARRSKVFIPCTLFFQGGNDYFGALVDMSSSGGMCVIKAKGNKTLPPIQVGSNINLHCLLPGIKEEQILHATIANMKQNNHETKLGLEFVDMHSFMIETINKFLFNINKLEQ